MKMFDSEDMRQMKFFNDARARGYYVDGTQLTNLYNKIFEASLKPTNCGSCLNMRYNSLKIAYDEFLKALERNTNEEEEKSVKQAKKGRKKKEDKQ